jgi:transaldolase
MTYVDRLAGLSDRGVSIWLDRLSRQRLHGGGLVALVGDRHVVGVPTNPTISSRRWQTARSTTAKSMPRAARRLPEEAARSMIGYDVRWACDVLRPVCNRTGGVDGRVSIEVDPSVAHDTAKTVAEAQALHGLIARPKEMNKTPATDSGLGAVTAATAEAISNKTEHRSPMQPRLSPTSILPIHC